MALRGDILGRQVVVLKALGWIALVVAFGAGLEVNRRFYARWGRHSRVIRFLMPTGYLLVVTRLMQLLVLVFGIVELVHIVDS